MSCDMIGLVAFNFILGIVFRSVMDITFVIEVSGMDGDNCPRHPARLGIPAHVIANLEPPSHPADLFSLPEALLPTNESFIPSNRIRRITAESAFLA